MGAVLFNANITLFYKTNKILYIFFKKITHNYFPSPLPPFN